MGYLFSGCFALTTYMKVMTIAFQGMKRLFMKTRQAWK